MSQVNFIPTEHTQSSPSPRDIFTSVQSRSQFITLNAAPAKVRSPCVRTALRNFEDNESLNVKTNDHLLTYS